MPRTGLVSVLMPNYNHAHYLPRALDAMLAQTWTDFEIIVVDDASTDNSREVIEDFAKRDPRVRSVALGENRGVNYAVMRALEVAEGEFICCAAADDFVAPNFLERCVTEMNHHPEAGLSFSDPTEYYEKEGTKIHYPLNLSDKPIFYSPDALVALFGRNYFHISSNTGLFRASAFRQAGGFDPDLHWLSDWFLVLVVACRHGACYLPESLTCLTVRGDSYSAQSLRDSRAQRPMLMKVLERFATPAYADVIKRFQDAGLIPEYRLRTLYWLLASPLGRQWVTPQLAIRIIGRGLWSYVRPLASPALRRRLRKLQNAVTRQN